MVLDGAKFCARMAFGVFVRMSLQIQGVKPAHGSPTVS